MSVDPQGVMGSGEKRSRTKATPEVIKLIENAVAYVTAPVCDTTYK